MNKSKVIFIKLDEINKIKEVLPDFPGQLGIKVHFGEEGNDAYVPAEFIKPIAEMVNYPNFIETSVLYKGKRSTAAGHKEVARAHGFDFCRIDILDGDSGDDSMAADLPSGKHHNKCYLGRNLAGYGSLLVISHFKGHIASGFGGAIKNLSMGLASRRGKLDMHANIKHQVKAESCISCGQCIENCPVNAIGFNEASKAWIDQNVCISCSKCIAVCPVSAIAIPWSVKGREFQERLAEYASAAASNKHCFYINFLINIVPQCDCLGTKQERLAEDIGILASADPIAIDQASYDLVTKQCIEFTRYNGENQLKHGESLGIGTRSYDLIRI